MASFVWKRDDDRRYHSTGHSADLDEDNAVVELEFSHAGGRIETPRWTGSFERAGVDALPIGLA